MLNLYELNAYLLSIFSLEYDLPYLFKECDTCKFSFCININRVEFILDEYESCLDISALIMQTLTQNYT